MLLQCKSTVNVSAGWEAPPCILKLVVLVLVALVVLDEGSVHIAGSKTSKRASMLCAM